MNNTLYLGSQSSVRQKILREAGIAVEVLGHDSDECIVQADLSFDDYVLEIAREKMRHVKMPHVGEGQWVFVLTADSLVRTKKTGQIFGKPDDTEDGKNMLRVARDEGIIITTGCCIHKIECKDGQPVTIDKQEIIASAQVEFCVDEDELDAYFSKEPDALKSAGAGILEKGYGLRFLKSINGDFSAALGLPLFEVCQILKKMNFF